MFGKTPKAAFVENLNTRFRMLVQDAVIEVELIAVIDRKSTPAQEQFSLMFLASPDGPLEQGIYTLEHDRLETGEIFLVPVSKDEKGVCYQAVFNRLIE